MKLSPVLEKNIRAAFGERGALFLLSFPNLVDEAAARWELTDIRAAENLSYNFVAFARREGEEVVLKIGVPDPELTSEIHSLRQFAGRRAVRLLDSDSGRGMLLLERLRPGELLTSIGDDRQATLIAAEVMRGLWRTGITDPRLIRLEDWFRRLGRFRDEHGAGTGPLDPRLFEQAESAARDFFAEDFVPTLIHGDLHHYNILSSRRGWLAIDPKGVIGPPGYEVGPFLLNPRTDGHPPRDFEHLVGSRLEILADALGMQQERLRLWALAFSVLSAVWCIQENDDFRLDMEAARILAELQV
ncbi:MAG TPA: aminoglycoside phosphotransferase family protein [Anaerolineales bacterium]